MTSTTLHHGDCLDVLATLPEDSIDAVITDPPYSLGFMGRTWDTFTPPEYQAFTTRWATESLRVLKPGGHLLAFGGSRTAHRLTTGIEDAGFDIRDTITWLYGSGFPKSMDVSKAIDKAAGAQRFTIGVAADFARDGAVRRTDGTHVVPQNQIGEHGYGDRWSTAVTVPATDDAVIWSGWGTALKPASEPIVVARKPFKGTITSNVLAHGTGALNIDATRVPHVSDADRLESVNKNQHGDFSSGLRNNTVYGADNNERTNYDGGSGRWPPNVVLTHAEDCTAECRPGCPVEQTGPEARFFPAFRYQTKASTRERPRVDGVIHPTVKPLALMCWLVRLVVPQGALILDPFAGSGTTLEAAVLEDVNVIGIEADATYIPLIEHRMHRIGAPLTLHKDIPA